MKLRIKCCCGAEFELRAFGIHSVEGFEWWVEAHRGCPERIGTTTSADAEENP